MNLTAARPLPCSWASLPSLGPSPPPPGSIPGSSPRGPGLADLPLSLGSCRKGQVAWISFITHGAYRVPDIVLDSLQSEFIQSPFTPLSSAEEIMSQSPAQRRRVTCSRSYSGSVPERCDPPKTSLWRRLASRGSRGAVWPPRPRLRFPGERSLESGWEVNGADALVTQGHRGLPALICPTAAWPNRTNLCLVCVVSTSCQALG